MQIGSQDVHGSMCLLMLISAARWAHLTTAMSHQNELANLHKYVPLVTSEVSAPLGICEGLPQDHVAGLLSNIPSSLHPEWTCWYCKQKHT